MFSGHFKETHEPDNKHNFYAISLVCQESMTCNRVKHFLNDNKLDKNYQTADFCLLSSSKYTTGMYPLEFLCTTISIFEFEA